MNNLNDVTANRSARNILGKSARVAVDRTYSMGKKNWDSAYLNCGSAELSDGSGSEAFVIGSKTPLTEYEGEIVAIAKARGSKKEIWIIAPTGSIFYEPQLVYMLVSYLPKSSYNYICLYEKSCGAVMYTQKDEERMYILIKNISGHIGFPKGHIEYGEDEKQTALREIYEETGIHARLIDGFRESYNYLINNFIRKRAVYFLAPFEEKNVKMDIREISEYKLVNLDSALKLLNFQHDREVLLRADKFIDGLM
jgi:NTP pyrophosphohydrolases including oxidative damage repair enzymes